MSKRNGHRRAAQLALAAALGALALAGAPSQANAAGGTYHVLQCHDWWRAANAMPPVDNNSSYSAADKCAAGDARLEVVNTGFGANGQGAWFAFNAPPGTTITEVWVTANLRRGSHHLAQIAVWNGTNNVVLANGPDANPSWQTYHWTGLNHPALVLLLQCQNGGGCNADGEAHLYARNISVSLSDWSDPAQPNVGGGLLSGGWLRGNQSFSSTSSDTGGGVWRVDASVNGQFVGRAESCNSGLGHPYSGHAVPCPGSNTLGMNVNTGAGPFQNGQNTITTWASDYGGNLSPGVTRTVLIDNAQPSLAFANVQDPEDPEVIRAPVSDQHSGVANAKLYMRAVGATDWIALETKVEGGGARARVDANALPAGEYEFRATATDVAGNAVETTTRENGDPMKLRFPLRGSVELQAHLGDGGGKGQTVPYGTDSSVSGRLLDSGGDPIAGKEVLIDENFGEGALIRHRPTLVTTDEDGTFSTEIPAGPTRRITATFAGTPKYAGAQRNVGELTVKSRVTFTVTDKTLPEGSTATFKGKIGHFGARIPAGGKLAELQVRLKTGRWDTVGQAFRTNEKGRYRRHYRFGKHYSQDALFRFRVKVQKESNWPYKRGASKQRKLIVKAR